MKKIGILILTSITLVVPVGLSAADAQIGQIQSITVRIVESPMRATGTSAIISVRAQTQVEGLRLRIKSSTGFEFTPSEIALPTFVGNYDDTIAITPKNETVSKGQATFQVVGMANGKEVSLTTTTVDLAYQPSISTRFFLFLGAVGVVLGWWIRLFINILKTTPPPRPQPTADDESGRITNFVKEHYYSVDLFVTLALSFFVMVALIVDGYPPVGGNYWYGALGMGMGLGLLTNSELITRLKR